MDDLGEGLLSGNYLGCKSCMSLQKKSQSPKIGSYDATARSRAGCSCGLQRLFSGNWVFIIIEFSKIGIFPASIG